VQPWICEPEAAEAELQASQPQELAQEAVSHVLAAVWVLAAQQILQVVRPLSLQKAEPALQGRGLQRFL
jgi:hypothetical protein